MQNPLLQEFTTNYESAPFSAIKLEHFKPAFEALIEEAKTTIDAIVSNDETPTFENTIESLEFSGSQLERVSSIFFNLNAAETTPDLQKLAQEISPLLSKFSNDITLNEGLFKRIKFVYNDKCHLDLSTEETQLLEKKYKSFERNGANLNEKDKEKLREIDQELATLKLKFGENVLAETNVFELHITNKSDLKGLPESSIEAASMLATQKNKEGWIYTLDYPSYIPFVTYAENRSLRKKMTLAFGSKAFKDNPNNNTEILKSISLLRFDRAQLLGYDSHAHFVLEERMAESPEKVNTFLRDLLDKATPAAISEFEELKKCAAKHGIQDLQKWDSAYISEKLKQELFELDQELLKPYFKLENVINGVFSVSNKLFGLFFEEIDSIDTYHSDVKTYKVYDSEKKYKALLYADFFPREGKRNGAWMTSYKSQWKKNKINSRPHISIVCNFTKPTKTKPSLLTFNELTTLFHEFGHALHGILANTTYPSLSGTNVYWDFVELPSQLMENWCYEQEALRLFAKHFETDEDIPMDIIAKIKASSNFLEGIQTLRQLSFGMLDMAWHESDPSAIKSVKDFESKVFEPTKLYPDIPENCMSTSFSHIFQGGYSSGYYSYKWAEVLDADAFSMFRENGLFDPETADLFKKYILEKGGTENPMKLYTQFRGKKPDNRALLSRAGLLTSKK